MAATPAYTTAAHLRASDALIPGTNPGPQNTPRIHTSYGYGYGDGDGYGYGDGYGDGDGYGNGYGDGYGNGF